MSVRKLSDIKEVDIHYKSHFRQWTKTKETPAQFEALWSCVLGQLLVQGSQTGLLKYKEYFLGPPSKMKATQVPSPGLGL